MFPKWFTVVRGKPSNGLIKVGLGEQKCLWSMPHIAIGAIGKNKVWKSAEVRKTTLNMAG